MTTRELSKRQQDVIKETLNIAMGTAGSAIADLLSVFVQLAVPDVKVVPRDALSYVRPASAPTAGSERLTVIHQNFHGALDGEAFVVFDETAPGAVSGLVGLDEITSRPEQRDALVEIAKTMITFSVSGLSRHLLAHEASFGEPSIVAEKVGVATVNEHLSPADKEKAGPVLLLKVRFPIENETLSGDLFVLLAESSIETVCRAADSIMARLKLPGS